MNKNLYIKSLILQAEYFSEEAHKYRHFSQNKKKSFCYKQKDSCLRMAINILKNIRNSDVQYKIKKGLDQNGHPSTILYFEWKEGGHKYQFSFHSFSDWKESGNKNIQWRGVIGECETNRIKILNRRNK